MCAPDPVTGFQQRDRASRLFQAQCGDQSGKTRTDDAVIDIRHHPPRIGS
jgi:hypothetical protein